MNKRMFLAKFFQSPQNIGSITPSSRFLTEAMFKPLDWSEINSIVELGAGTGVFTNYIKEHKKPECQVVVFEKDDEMRANLQKIYPFFHFGKEAREILPTVQEIGLQQVDCIISGLPFANFPQSLRTEIMDNVMAALKDNALFIAFQYSLQMKKQLETYFGDVRISFVPLNIPPAFVYYCQKVGNKETKLITN